MAKIDKINDYIEKILKEPLEDIVSERFARYSKYIIQDRALPDARDGLKPVQRRILYAMHALGMQHNKPYKKSARIAGEVMGKYHPHGDLSIYEAMVRMSQDFKMLIPLIDMHGNNGSIDGDSAAAMRYTEARLSEAAEFLLEDIDKRTVPFVPNFDDEEIEPTVLPAKFPNLLVNGASGISAGYATKIPPHNVGEVIDATIALLENEQATIETISTIIKGPDFPTGGIVQGSQGILSALQTGTGKMVLRSKTYVEEMSKTQDRIVVTEIPYEVNKSELVRSIDMLRIDKKLEDLLEIRDETDQQGLRIAIDLKKGADTQTILTYLFKNTNLQVIYNYNLVSILNHRPILSGVIPVLKAYISHQKEVITNRSNYELDRANKRQHIVQGLVKMVSVVEEVIKIIRKSNNKADAKLNIQAAFGFTEIQAEAIVTLQLYRLSNTDIIALQQEDEQLSILIKQLEHILSSEKALRNVIKKELLEVKGKLNVVRKTVIESEIETLKIDEQKLISDEQVMIAVTKDGYIKKSSIRSYQASTQIGLKVNDALMFKKEVSSLDTLLIFTNLGNYIFLPVHKIDEQKWKDLGLFIGNVVDIDKSEMVIHTMVVSKFDTKQSILCATKQGMMKQIKLSDLEVQRYSKSIRYMKLNKDDEVKSIDIDERQLIISVSKNGYALVFKTEELPLYGLSAGGVKSMLLTNDDQLSSAKFAQLQDEILMLTSRGHIIRDYVSELPIYNRNRRGIHIIATQKANPHDVVSLSAINKQHYKENVNVTVLGTKGGIDMPISETKYTNNKFGKLILNAEYGDGYKLIIDQPIEWVISDEIPSTKVVKQRSIKETKTALFEEVILKDKQKIKLSRLDLFDDDEE